MVFSYGDNIDTDRIIAGKYTKSLPEEQLAQHALEDLDPAFAATVQPGDLVVGGWNFGCGSSREQAPIALKQTGIRVVIARSFARIFFRNAINIGLPLLEINNHHIDFGDAISVDLSTGEVVNHTKNETYIAAKIPPVMLAILNEGGLVPYLRKHGDYQL
jgi:3-isopropylmalate dehydratase small subunit